MPFESTTYRLMIASPSDVVAERRIVHEVVAGWNAVNAADKASVILPIAWESHAPPEMGDRPQSIINARLLKDADLLVAVFWTRLGSPTGAALSGTVEEIEEHIAAGRPAMIYFSQAPIAHDADLEQYAAVKRFQTSLQPRGLYATYTSVEDFREKLSRHLGQVMIRISSMAAGGRVVVAKDFVLADDLTDQVAAAAGPAGGALAPAELAKRSRDLAVLGETKRRLWGSSEGVQQVAAEAHRLMELLGRQAESLKEAAPELQLQYGQTPEAFVIKTRYVAVHIGYLNRIVNVLDDARLRVRELRGNVLLPGESGMYYRQPDELSVEEWVPELTQSSGWAWKGAAERIVTSEELASDAVRRFFALLDRHSRGELPPLED